MAYHITSGIISSGIILNNNSMYISSGGVANNTTVNDWGDMYISSGGTANSTMVNSIGEMYISSGGVVNCTTVNSGGHMRFYNGGVANNTTVNSNGVMNIPSGGVANSTTVNYLGRMYISSGGVVNSTTVNGDMSISSGGTANSTTVNSSGWMYIGSGGTATNIIASRGGMLNITVASNTYITGTYNNSAFEMKDAKISGYTIMSGGYVHIYSGGVANSTTVNSGGWMSISSGGTASSTAVNPWGYMSISSSGVANSTTVNSYGHMYIYSGGVANSTTVNSDGVMHIESGGVANSTTINFGGDMRISSGGTATNIIASSGGRLNITVASNTYITGTYNNSAFEMKDAKISGYTIMSGGYVHIYSGGVANSTTVNSGGYMEIDSAGVHRGSLQINSGAVVSAYSGSIIDFTIADRTASDGYLINDLSLVSGAPTYTITVSAIQAEGIYKLAQGAANFNSTISIGDGTINYGSITVNGAILSKDGIDYRVIQESGNLILEIDDPTSPTAEASTTAPTNNDVTVTATFSSDSIVKQYKIGTGNWTDYTAPFVVSENNTIYFRAENAAGRESSGTLVISNIDKVAPTMELSADKTTPTNQDVVLTATVSDGTVEYYNGSAWVAGSSLTVSENGTYQFRVTDAAGNMVEQSIEVSNIDKVAPTMELSADKTTPTNQDVILTATVSDGTVEYYDGSAWVAGSSLTVSENGTYQFRVTDAAGNMVEQSIEVSNIDKVAPTAPTATASTTTPTNRDVTVTATFSSDSTVKQYKIGNGSWINYTAPFAVSANGTISLRAQDAAGNESTGSLVIANIDKVAPTAPTATASTTTPTNNDVTVTAAFSDDSTVKQYKIGDGNWTDYTAPFAVSANATVSLRAQDAAGNESTGSLVIANIDKVAPTTPTATASTTAPTNQNVMVTATFSSDSTVKQYKIGNGNWINYTGVFTVSDNTTVSLRAEDAAGNESTGTLVIANIDKVAPTAPTAAASTTAPTNNDVTVTATFSSDSTVKQYKIGNGEWIDYTGAFTVSDNTTIALRAEDAAGNESTGSLVIANIDKVAPAVPTGFNEIISGYNATLDWSDVRDTGIAGTNGYYVRFNTTENLTGDGEFVAVSRFNLTALPVGNYYYQIKSEDRAGNVSDWSAIQSFEIIPGAVQRLQGNQNALNWDAISGVQKYIAEYSNNNFANVLQLETSTNAVDTYQMPNGTWKARVKAESAATSAQTGFTATAPTGSAAQIVSDADGNLDVFFARTAGTWDDKHLAKHLGDFNGWQGTKERVALTGKNIITDVFTGSTDANVLVLTDDSNGDALFLDDMYSALGNQARLGNIDEIRAGAGNDVIDLTSPKFAYLGDEMTVFGGAGDDTIWANSGENTLYGDAGNDRIIGGAGNDFIIGGAGNDALHGGGGSDTFCFGANWGTDIVEQLANGKVILRFETGSMSNWNASTGVYSDGTNTVTVTGSGDIELYFGTASTLPEDAFAPASSEKIFEQLA